MYSVSSIFRRDQIFFKWYGGTYRNAVSYTHLPAEYDEKTVKKRWKEDSAKCMTELAAVIAGIEDFSIEGQEKVVMDWIAEKGYHTGNIMNAFRLTDVYKRQVLSRL